MFFLTLPALLIVSIHSIKGKYSCFIFAIFFVHNNFKILLYFYLVILYGSYILEFHTQNLAAKVGNVKLKFSLEAQLDYLLLNG